MKLPYSLNNRIVVEPYAKTELKTTVNKGFAQISQKKNVVGLKVLVDCEVVVQGGSYGWSVKAGDTAYFKENELHTHPLIKDTLVSDGVKGDFLILEAHLIQFIVPKQEEVSTYEHP